MKVQRLKVSQKPLSAASASYGRPTLSAGIGAWSVAIGLALAGQRLLTSSGPFTPPFVLFSVAVFLGVVGAELIDRAVPPMDPLAASPAVLEAARTRPSTARKNAGALLIAAGLLLDGLAVDDLAKRGSSSTAMPLWIFAMLALTSGVALWATMPWKLPRRRAQLIELLGVLAVVGLAFAFRFPSLTGIPADVHGDEAAVGIEARRILTGEATNLFGLGWSSLPEMSFVPSALSMRIFGNDLFGLRMASVIQGCLSVALLYGMVKRLFSVRVAAIAAVTLAVSQMAIHYSRTGNNYIGALFTSLLLFYFLLRGLSNRQPMEFLVAGFAAGMALSVYYPARLTLALAFLYCAHRAIGERDFLREHLPGLAVLVVAAGLFFVPQVVWYFHDPLSALNRTSGVLVLRPDNLEHEYGAYQVHSVAGVLWRQFVNSIDAFNLRGETSMQYGQSAPLLDFWSSALFVLGAVLVSTRLRTSRYFLVASWFWLSIVLGSVLTVDAMFSPRLVAIVGVLAVLPALILDTGWRGLAARFGREGERAALVVVVGFLIAVGWANYVDYFEVHVKTMEPASFFTVLSRYVEGVNSQYRVYLLANRDTSLKYDTAHFLIPDVDGVDVRDWPLPMPLARIPAQKGVVFVDTSDKDPRFLAIRSQYPGGRMDVLRSTNGSTQFYAYRVDHADLVAADPSATVDHAPIPAIDLDKLPPPF